MRVLLVLSVALGLSGCAPLVIGVAAGFAVSHHEAHRNWCIQYYGNPSCYKRGRPTAYTYRMPMGVHQ